MCSGKKKNNFTGAQIKEKNPTKTKYQTNQCCFKAINYSTVWFSRKFPCKFQWNWCITDMMWNVKLMLTVFEKYLFSAGCLTFLVSGFCGKISFGCFGFCLFRKWDFSISVEGTGLVHSWRKICQQPHLFSVSVSVCLSIYLSDSGFYLIC